MTELLPILIATPFIFAAGWLARGMRGNRPMLRPSSLQRALSDCVSNEIRVARSQGTFDGWDLAHRTDSHPGNVSGSPVTVSTK